VVVGRCGHEFGGLGHPDVDGVALLAGGFGHAERGVAEQLGLPVAADLRVGHVDIDLMDTTSMSGRS